MSSTMAEVVEQVTEYRVSAAPLDDYEGSRFALIVRWNRTGSWMIIDGLEPPSYIGADGRWSWEALPGDPPEGWRDAYRFDLPTALRIARETAPKVKINGRTWAEWQAHWAGLPCTCAPDAGPPDWDVQPCGRCAALGRARDKAVER